jgi:serine/threonine protein kinase
MVGDLGVSKSYAGTRSFATDIGHPCAAPEQMMGDEDHYTYAADLWSVGYVTHFLLCGKYPIWSPESGRPVSLLRPTKVGVSEPAINFVDSLIQMQHRSA